MSDKKKNTFLVYIQVERSPNASPYASGSALRRFAFHVYPDTFVARLKSHYALASGIDNERICLRFRGTEMRDLSRISAYNIKDGETIVHFTDASSSTISKSHSKSSSVSNSSSSSSLLSAPAYNRIARQAEAHPKSAEASSALFPRKRSWSGGDHFLSFPPVSFDNEWPSERSSLSLSLSAPISRLSVRISRLSSLVFLISLISHLSLGWVLHWAANWLYPRAFAPPPPPQRRQRQRRRHSIACSSRDTSALPAAVLSDRYIGWRGGGRVLWSSLMGNESPRRGSCSFPKSSCGWKRTH